MKRIYLPGLTFVALFTLQFQTSVFAVDLETRGDGSLSPGQSLPLLDIDAGSEIFVNDDKIIKTPWSSTSFDKGDKVQLVQYIAANRGAIRQNKRFTDSLINMKFSSKELDTTVIVHMADTMSLFKGIIVNRMAKNKVKHQSINFVIDDNGVGLQRWGMKNKSFAVIVLDAGGSGQHRSLDLGGGV